MQSILPIGALAHLARALDWQSKGDEFESRMLHSIKSIRLCKSFFLLYSLFCFFSYLCETNITNKTMLIYNTTYQVDMDDARNFVIWLTECYIPEVEKNGKLKNARLVRILTHQDPDSECFSLQWEVEDSASLHHWHTEQGMAMNEEMMKVFKDKVVGFPTLMEVIK